MSQLATVGLSVTAHTLTSTADDQSGVSSSLSAVEYLILGIANAGASAGSDGDDFEQRFLIGDTDGTRTVFANSACERITFGVSGAVANEGSGGSHSMGFALTHSAAATEELETQAWAPDGATGEQWAQVIAIPLTLISDSGSSQARWHSETANSDTIVDTPTTGYEEVGTTLTFTPNRAGDYWVTVSAELVGDGTAATTDEMDARVTVDGAVVSGSTIQKDVGDRSDSIYSYLYSFVVNLDETEHGIAVEVNGTSSNGNVGVRRIRIHAIESAIFVDGVQQATDAGATTPATGDVDVGFGLTIGDGSRDELCIFNGQKQVAFWGEDWFLVGGTESPASGFGMATGEDFGTGATDDMAMDSGLLLVSAPAASTTLDVRLTKLGGGGVNNHGGDIARASGGDMRLLVVPMEVYDRVEGSSSGSTTLSGTLSDVGGGASPIVGNTDGNTALSGTLTGTGALAGTAAGDTALSGTLTATGALDGEAAGSTTLSGTLAATGALAGTAAGDTALSGTLAATGALDGEAAGSTSLSGTLSSDGAMTGTASGSSTLSGTLTGIGALASAADDLRQYDDSFIGSDFTAQWDELLPSAVAVEVVADGEAQVEPTQGGAAGSHWFDDRDGLYRRLTTTITGGFDARCRMRVRDSAGTSSPPTAGGEFRFAGLAVHDPTRTTPATDYNYVHVMFGSDPNGANRLEWKTTDSSDSTFDSDAGSAPLDYDLRVVRDPDDLQLFTLYTRRTDLGEELGSDVGWNLLQTIDRDDNTTPTRTTATNMPAAVEIGWSGGYAGPQLDHDIQSFMEEFRLRRTTPESAHGQTTLIGTMLALALATGTSAGQTTAAGTLTATGELAGTTAGSTALLGTLTNAPPTGAIDGTTAGSTTATGTLTGTGALVGTVSGSTASTGTLTGSGALVGTTAGDTTATGTVTAIGALQGSADGSTVLSGTLLAQSNLGGTSAGATVLSGTLTATGALAGTISGSTTPSGTLTSTAQISGTSAGATALSGTLQQSPALAGTVSGSTSLSGTLTGTGELSGTINGSTTVVGAVEAAFAFGTPTVITLPPSVITIIRIIPTE